MFMTTCHRLRLLYLLLTNIENMHYFGHCIICHKDMMISMSIYVKMILNASYPFDWKWVRVWFTLPIQPYHAVGSVPLHSKAGLDTGLNLLLQTIIYLGMRIWFLDCCPHVCKPLQFASLLSFPLKSFCLAAITSEYGSHVNVHCFGVGPWNNTKIDQNPWYACNYLDLFICVYINGVLVSEPTSSKPEALESQVWNGRCL